MPFAALGALAMELTLRKPPITTAALGLFTFDNVTTLDAVQREFGFAPKSLPAYLAERGV
jgi:NADH dehydrogenase